MKSIQASILFVFVLFLAAGCGGSRQYQIQGLDRAAGADGEIQLERQDGGNWTVEIHVTNLLPPGRLTEGMTTYSVWFQAPEQNPQRVGNLAYDEDDRAGTTMATTSLTRFDIFVTAENSEAAAAPSADVVFRTTAESP